MAELHVSNLPPDVHLWLRQRAEAQGSSLSDEAVEVLRAALAGARPGARREAIDQLRAIRQRTTAGPKAGRAEDLVRTDRERLVRTDRERTG